MIFTLEGSGEISIYFFINSGSNLTLKLTKNLNFTLKKANKKSVDGWILLIFVLLFLT